MFVWLSSITKIFSSGAAAPGLSFSPGVHADLIAIDRGGVALMKRVNSLQDQVVDIGFFADSGAHPESRMPMAMHAATHVYGNPDTGLPARDFMRTTFENEKPAILQATAAAAREIILGRRKSVQGTFHKLGEFYADLMRENILRGNWDALAPMTISRKYAKGSLHPTDPLLDTEAMFDSISHKVRFP